MSNGSQQQDQMLDIEVLKQFRIIFKSVRRHFQSIEQACGISGAQLWALAKIAEIQGLTVTKLAGELAIHQTTASNLVEKLVTKGLVSKVRQQEDQRFVVLVLTDSGSGMLDSAPIPLQGLLPDALGKMPYRKLLQLHELLAELQGLMEHTEDEAAAMPLSEDDV